MSNDKLDKKEVESFQPALYDSSFNQIKTADQELLKTENQTGYENYTEHLPSARDLFVLKRNQLLGKPKTSKENTTLPKPAVARVKKQVEEKDTGRNYFSHPLGMSFLQSRK